MVRSSASVANSAVWKQSLAAWLLSSLVLLGIGGVVQLLGLVSPNKSNYFGVEPILQGWQALVWGIWQRWDAIHYIRLVQSGYGQPDLSAFFPLYPMTARLLAWLTAGLPATIPQDNALICLLLITNLAFIGCAVLLGNLYSELCGNRTNSFVVVALTTYPHAYFLHAPYTEALALFLTLATLSAAWHGRWLFACGLGFLAGLTRPTVFPVSLMLFYLAWQNRRRMGSWNLLPFLSAGTPILGLVGFLGWRQLAGFPDYSGLVYEIWGRHFAWPWQTVANLVRMSSVGIPSYTWVNLIVLVGILVLTGWGLRRLPAVLQIYQISLLLFLVFNTLPYEPWGSIGRYTLLLFPTYLLVAMWASTPARRLTWFALAVTLQLFLAGQFFMWGWTG